MARGKDSLKALDGGSGAIAYGSRNSRNSMSSGGPKSSAPCAHCDRRLWSDWKQTGECPSRLYSTIALSGIKGVYNRSLREEGRSYNPQRIDIAQCSDSGYLMELAFKTKISGFERCRHAEGLRRMSSRADSGCDGCDFFSMFQAEAVG